MRKAGILLPIFSLPSNYGIGSLGKEAYNFVDFLARTGQAVWQILPITSTCSDDAFSPYKTNGAFSGNSDFVDIELLVEEGLISKEFLNSLDFSKFYTDPRYVDYEKVRKFKDKVFREAIKNFDFNSNNYRNFISENKFWLDEYSTYMSLKELNNNKPYWEWSIIKNEEELNIPENNDLQEKFEFSIKYNNFLQFLFFHQWSKLKEYANKNGIEIFGDIPIYISQDSSDFYYHRELFLTGKDGEPTFVAGVPADEFSATGQLWGNPLYNWKYIEKTNFDWWIKRIKKSLELYDILRIDHFRGLESYYCIDRSTEDAINGYWEKAPGKTFFDCIKKEVPNANIVAEDLGTITNEVMELLEYSGFPGMKIVQFGFSTGAENMHLPYRFHPNTVAYTGTHDNMTLSQWLETAPRHAVDYAKQYLKLDAYSKYSEGLIRAVIGSSSNLAIVPIQDWLDFGGWARINTPSTIDNNWKFRIFSNELSPDLESYISYITGLYGRYKNR